MRVKSQRDGIYFAVVLRHLNLEHAIAGLRVEGKNFYAFTPYSLDGSIGLDNHVSYHASGERHVRSRYRAAGEMRDVPGVRDVSVTHFERPANLKGAVQIYLGGDPFGQFRELKPLVGHNGERVLLDGEKGGLREGPFVVKIYAVESGNVACVPVAPDVGARVLHFIKTTDPWIAIDVYQPNGV
jgi:hypothetical protein